MERKSTCAVLSPDTLMLQFLAQCFRCICLHNVFISWMNTELLLAVWRIICCMQKTCTCSGL